MKKIISLLILCAMIFALSLTMVSCEDSDISAALDLLEGQVTKEQWEEAKASANFDNVRCDFTADFISGYDAGEVCVEYFEIDGDLVATVGEVFDDEEMVTTVKSVYIGTVTSVLDNFEDFTFDAEKGYYVASKPISYQVNILGTEATITAENTIVKINKDQKIASIACRMTQEFVEYGQQLEYVLDVEFKFSNYGTTKLELVTEE